jgi:endoglucanase
MGNLHCVKESPVPGAETVMVACHMDEIGFIVNYIDENGFISVQPLGGFDPRNLFSRRVKVVTDETMYRGVMNPEGLPIHLSKPEDRTKVPSSDEFIIDIGLGAKALDVISVGDFVVMDEPFIKMGNKLVSKALDNRVACFMGIELLREVHDIDLGVNLHVVFTVQEEVGLRGAKTSSMIVKPDISIGVDVTLACDTPGVPPKKHVTTQGKGCAVGVRDSSFISDKALVKRVQSVAKDKDIPYQLVVSSGGGMDGAAMQQAGSGSRAIAISVGTRYIHTVTEMIDIDDLEAGLNLLIEVVKDL